MSIRWFLIAGVVLLGLLFLLPPLADGPRPNGERETAEHDAVEDLAALPFADFVETSFRLLQLRDPDTLIWNELGEAYGVEDAGRFTETSPSAFAATYAFENGILEGLRQRDRDALSPDEQLTYDIYEWYLDDLVRWHAFGAVDYCNNPYDLQNTIVDFLTAFPIRDDGDAEDYLERLSTFGTWMDGVLQGYEIHEASGALPPRYLIRLALTMTEQYVPSDESGVRRAEACPLYFSFQSRLTDAEVTAHAADRFLARAEEAIEATVIPAFRRFEAYLTNLETHAGDEISALRLADGAAYYATSLRHHTTLDCTPAQIHERALVEVARLQNALRAAATELAWPEGLTIGEISQRISEANEPIEGEALRIEYERLIAEATATLPRSFDQLPKADLIVDVNPDSTFAYYAAPALDGSAPGRMVTNLVSVIPYTPYDEPVLMHHETVPGHHLQIALAQDLGLVNVRRDTVTSLYVYHPNFQPYVEGWALYAEGLAEELGLYADDPLGNACRLRLELQRTARSVVDTSIHAYGWTWEAAADYLEQATGVRPRQSAMLRYFTQPGQSCGYTLGMWTIRDLRAKAAAQLGDAFDLREFHRVVLGAGPMPLTVLQQHIEEWIASTSASE